MNEKVVIAYTDGSCLNSKGNAGGWGAVLTYNGHDKYLSNGSYYNTTSSRMEMMAIIEAMKAIHDKSVKLIIYSDSQFICNSVNLGWLEKWEKQLFKGRVNYDLWIHFLVEMRKFKLPIELKWIKGHNGDHYNEMADTLAGNAGASPIKIKDNKL